MLKLFFEDLLMMLRDWVWTTVEWLSAYSEFEVNFLVGKTSQLAAKNFGKLN
jgi:hypothetical protein